MKYVIMDNTLHITTCKKLIDTIGGTFISTLEEAVKLDPLKICSCIRRRYFEVRDRINQKRNQINFRDEFINIAKLYGVHCEVNHNDDLVIKTQVECWILSIISVKSSGDYAEVCLYHKSMSLNRSQKCGVSLYPEYHVQFNKSMSTVSVLRYIMKHEHMKYRIQHDFKDLPKLY